MLEIRQPRDGWNRKPAAVIGRGFERNLDAVLPIQCLRSAIAASDQCIDQSASPLLGGKELGANQVGQILGQRRQHFGTGFRGREHHRADLPMPVSVQDAEQVQVVLIASRPTLRIGRCEGDLDHGTQRRSHNSVLTSR